MVCIREHKHKRLTCHLVATVFVCAGLPAAVIATTTMIMRVAPGKEAAP
jgi:hypothetical protein